MSSGSPTTVGQRLQLFVVGEGSGGGKAKVQERSDRIEMIMATKSIMLESAESRGSGDLDDYCVPVAGWWGRR